MEELYRSRDVTGATLGVLEEVYNAFTLSTRTEGELVDGAVDLAYENLQALERTLNGLREKNPSLAILRALDERVGVLKDVLLVETEKTWSRLVFFGKEGDTHFSKITQYTLQTYYLAHF